MLAESAPAIDWAADFRAQIETVATARHTLTLPEISKAQTFGSWPRARQNQKRVLQTLQHPDDYMIVRQTRTAW